MTRGIMTFTAQEKCAIIISQNIVNARFAQLNRERATAFTYYFKKKNVEGQVKMAGANSVIPYNGFSFYRIEYNGELPESLKRAYAKMNDLNEDGLRKKFKVDRNNSNKMM
jgi:hypothetical protein